MTEHQRLRAQQNLKEGIPDKTPPPATGPKDATEVRLTVDVEWVGVFNPGDRVLIGVSHPHATQPDLDRLSSLLEERFPGVEFTVVPDGRNMLVLKQPPGDPVPTGNDR